MALNENVKGIISAVAKNDIRLAKGYAKCLLAEDKTAKNRDFCRQMLNRLSISDVNFLKLPAAVEKNAVCEDVSASFHEDRYYLPQWQEELAGSIIKKRKVCAKMESLGIRMANTTLLYGEPGTGKTEFAKYVAFRMGIPCLYVNFSQCIDSYMGVTAKNIAEVFRFAREHECVFVMDEIDTIAGNRSGNDNTGADGERNRTTITIMQEFDRLPGSTVLIATTNRKDLLDSALLNRFSVTQEFPLMEPEESILVAEKFYHSVKGAMPETLKETVRKLDRPRDVIKYTVNHIVKEIEEETEEDSAPEKEISVSPEEYKKIEGELQNYVLLEDVADISAGTMLKIYRKTYEQAEEVRKRPLLRTVKCISDKIPYTDWHVVSW